MNEANAKMKNTIVTFARKMVTLRRHATYFGINKINKREKTANLIKPDL